MDNERLSFDIKPFEIEPNVSLANKPPRRPWWKKWLWWKCFFFSVQILVVAYWVLQRLSNRGVNVPHLVGHNCSDYFALVPRSDAEEATVGKLISHLSGLSRKDGALQVWPKFHTTFTNVYNVSDINSTFIESRVRRWESFPGFPLPDTLQITGSRRGGIVKVVATLRRKKTTDSEDGNDVVYAKFNDFMRWIKSDPELVDPPGFKGSKISIIEWPEEPIDEQRRKADALVAWLEDKSGFGWQADQIRNMMGLVISCHTDHTFRPRDKHNWVALATCRAGQSCCTCAASNALDVSLPKCVSQRSVGAKESYPCSGFL